MSAAIRVQFGVPHHGWLPVRFDAGDVALAFDASDVPNNPVQQLIDAVTAVSQGGFGEVWWHLEPAGYYFAWSPTADGVLLQVTYSPESRESQRTEVATIAGSREETLLPFWRALRHLEAQGLAGPHWPDTDFDRLVRP